MSWSPDYVVLCVLLISPKCLGGKCLGSKFLHRVNASAPASTWMVRYVISSTPFRWHVRCDCSASLFCLVWLFRLAFGTLCGLAVSLICQHPLWWCCFLSVWVWCFVFVWLGESFAGWKRWSVSLFIVDVVVVAFAGTKRSLGRSVTVYLVECVLAWFLAEFVFHLCVA